ERVTNLAKLESIRTQRTRTETQHAGAIQVVADLRGEHTRRGAGQSEPIEVAQRRCASALAEIDRDVAEIDQQLGTLAGNATTEEQVARTRVADAERAVALAVTQREQRQKASNAARDAAIQATTRLETTRVQAADHDAGGAWTLALVEGTSLDVTPWRAALVGAEHHHAAARTRATQLANDLQAKALERATTIQAAREAAQAADRLARTARTMLDSVNESHHECETSFAAIQVSLAQMQAERANANPDGARAAIELLQPQLAALGDGVAVDASTVGSLETSVDGLERGVRELEEEVARARGALEQVGGAIVRERQVELDQAIHRAEQREHQIEVEYDAWKLLVETLRESESTQGTHLGRVLAAPISKRFHELTGGRYGDFELGAHLEAGGLHAAGETRAISALSAGTQDQLATLLRLCIAEQIHSSIVLDDHLSQSDPDKVGWFNKVLRAAGSQIQIILITCRPAEVLGTNELAPSDSAVRHTAAGLVTSIDLARVIQRYGTATRSRSAG
nr:hypothetical protein [Deltaproteobacteria bacterium]